MNSLRPLVTITILVVVGAFLYVKINQGPPRLSGTSEAWPAEGPSDVPPLTPMTGADAASGGAAPAWPAAPPTAILSAETTPSTAGEAGVETPQLPAIPELPPVGAAQAEAAANTAAPFPTDLPANIPTAQYPDQPKSSDIVAAPQLSQESTAPPNTLARQETPSAIPQSPEQANDHDIATNSLSSPPLAAEQKPLRETPQPTAEDRYAILPTATTPITSVQPFSSTQDSFAAEWPTIQAALERGELSRAHQMLTRWYNDPSLTPIDAETVDTLLSQLAGTVVYSTEHQLEPAHVVKPGETLETIAKQYDVPWQLLAKINGIPAADQVQPGRELKVVRGPFSATIDVSRKELTLMLGDRYAGKFSIAVPAVSAVSEGEWLVDKKLADSPSGVTQSGYSPAPAATDRAIVLRSETAAGGSASTVAIASGNISARSSAAGTAVIQVSPQDAEELADILSIGSRVVIQR